MAGCIAVLAKSTFAYVTVNSTARNVITAGGVSIHLNEKTTDKLDESGNPTDFVNLELGNVMPTAKVSKIVTVTNEEDSAEVFVRVKVERELIMKQDERSEAADGLMEIDFNTKEWTFKDGWYYYNTSVESGKTTFPLFENVTFHADMGNEYQNATGCIIVYGQAVQTANNGDNPMEATGWPIN